MRDDFDGLRAAINEKTRAVYTETLGNPKLDVADIETLAAIAHEHGLPLIIDNTSRLAGAGAAHRVGRGHRGQLGHQVPRRPRHGHRRRDCGCRQVRLGRLRAASRTSSSPIRPITASRYTEAFGPLAFILKARVQGLRDTGAALSPFNAFLLLQGIETLHLRMERHSRECAGRGQASGAASRRGVGQLSRPRNPAATTRAPRSICLAAAERW